MSNKSLHKSMSERQCNLKDPDNNDCRFALSAFKVIGAQILK